MPRYIDAENIPTKFINFGVPTVICGIEVPDIDSAPTLTPDDLRGVGEWKQKEIFNIEDTTIEQMQSARCSVCGKYHTTPFSYYFTEYNYCPSCGAAMQNTKKKQHTMDEFMYGQEGNPADGSL